MADKKITKPQAVVTNKTSLDVDALRDIVNLLEASEVSRLDWTNGDERLTIRRGPPTQFVHHSAPVHAAVHPVAASVTSVEVKPKPSVPSLSKSSAEPEKKGQIISSPFVGTFYRTPAPDQPSFVEVGAKVKKGQVVCIVEAMKLMNEIEADISGTVVEVLVSNATPVEFGQALFRVEP